MADVKIIGAYDDFEAIRKLAEISDCITYEFENIDAASLEWLCNNANVPQGRNLLEITQNRIKEKIAIEVAGGQVAPYAVIHSLQDITEAIQLLGVPAVLKTAQGWL